MAQSLADASKAVAALVTEVLPAMSRAIKVSVEAVAAARTSGVLDVEQRLSWQIDAVVVTTRTHRYDPVGETP